VHVKGKRIVMTGGSGLLGSQLGPLLVNTNNVTTVGRTKPSWAGNHIHCDFSTDWSSDNFPDDCDTVIHLAQSEHFRNFPQKALDIYHTNITSLLKLLEYARNTSVTQFVMASSGGVYGTREKPYSETDHVDATGNIGFYLSTKLSGELLAANYEKYFNVIMLRYFFIYGKHQRSDMLIPRLIGMVKRGDSVVLQGQDGIRLNPIHVRDAALATASSLSLSDSCRINVAGPEVVSLRELVGVMGEIIGRKPEVSFNEDIDPKHLVGEIDKMRELLSPPKIGLAEGLAEVAAR